MKTAFKTDFLAMEPGHLIEEPATKMPHITLPSAREPFAGGRIHQRASRKVMANEMSAELAIRPFPTAKWLYRRGQARVDPECVQKAVGFIAAQERAIGFLRVQERAWQQSVSRGA
jgi:hypothetical protein